MQGADQAECWVFEAQDERDTDRLGQWLAETLPDGMTLALQGTLGAGKTRLVRALAQSCGVPAEEVVSPTFVLCQHYHGQRTLHHLDAYRLRDEDEFLQLGPEEFFESSGLTLIEWADRVWDCLPDAFLEVRIGVASETGRDFTFVPHGPAAREALRNLVRRATDA